MIYTPPGQMAHFYTNRCHTPALGDRRFCSVVSVGVGALLFAAMNDAILTVRV
ncbi:MAG: hypothetical protein H7Z11_14850 [Verrucomicrobia bacterium]|nr:hypothetical protein [Leptolyngbya sp. ES-bin-22]